MKKFARVIKDECVACGACLSECPRNAISIFKGCYSVIDETMCVGCGLCAKACPAQAIEKVMVE